MHSLGGIIHMSDASTRAASDTDTGWMLLRAA